MGLATVLAGATVAHAATVRVAAGVSAASSNALHFPHRLAVVSGYAMMTYPLTRALDDGRFCPLLF